MQRRSRTRGRRNDDDDDDEEWQATSDGNVSVGDDEGSQAGIGVYAGLSQYFGSAVFWLWMPLLSFKMARDGMADEAPSMHNIRR